MFLYMLSIFEYFCLSLYYVAHSFKQDGELTIFVIKTAIIANYMNMYILGKVSIMKVLIT